LSPSEELSGRVALVTGGARGLGRAIALALASDGADVAIAARSAGPGSPVEREIEALGRRALMLAADVTERGAADEIVEATAEQLGRLDIVVNNSGVTHVAPALETSDDAWEQVIATNLTAAFRVARAAGRLLTAQRSGKVINVASMVGLRGASHLVAYCASKAGLINMTRALALEWAQFGVQVNALAPGYVETDMNADVREDDARLERILRRVPAGRMAGVEEIASAAAYLASPKADYVTGSVLVIDGGYTAI
jgi:2-deoxy-D-gluconate 3-dehydrogenase